MNILERIAEKRRPDADWIHCGRRRLEIRVSGELDLGRNSRRGTWRGDASLLPAALIRTTASGTM